MLKLNWFSPLPPARTDIAHYTKRLVPALSRIAQVTLWTDQREWDRQLESFAIVRKFTLNRMPWVELNHADMTFYQMGNDQRFHGTIWEVSRQLAGVVVLHDYRLHDFFDILFRTKRKDPHPYYAAMARYYGQEGLRDARNLTLTRDYMAERYPLTEFALENSLGVLVHTEQAFESVAAVGRWPLSLAPLPFPSRKLNNRRTTKERDQLFQLVLFGYIGRNRRLESVLQALAQMENRQRYHLDVFGVILDDEKALRAQVRTLKLDKCVTIHGFTSEDALDKALSECDLAINLRFPTMGEASGSQLRIWAHAVPSLVSQVGWYASLPEDSVAFVRTDENEIDDIKKHLVALVEFPEKFVAMGERGRQELEEKHSPDSYARSVIELAERAQCFRHQKANIELAERAARIASPWLNSAMAADTFRRVATEVYAMAKRC
jgi:glycosyltransferase involved in cell wall biosynthesis